MNTIHRRLARMALDETTRSYDADGRLRVSRAVVTSACVSPYSGNEIVDADRLGLDARQVYNLLRPASELQKALPKFNNIPVLNTHVLVNAADHRPGNVVGATGSNARFDGANVTCDLIIWAKDAIDAIESGAARELSMGYRYAPVLRSGTHNGVPFQIEMTDIVPNHLALVPQARIPGAMVGDALPDTFRDNGDLKREIAARLQFTQLGKTKMADADTSDDDLMTQVAKFLGEKGMKPEDIKTLLEMLAPEDAGAAMDGRSRIMVAMDKARAIRHREYAAGTKAFNERFPHASRVRVIG